jgi:type I restriction enzyme M protein
MSVYIKSDNKGKKRSDTPTPIWLCDFLHNILSVKEYPTILDCCAGDKRLTNNFKNSNIINYEIKEGTNFLEETNPIKCDLVIMNPPFNIGTGRKLAVEVFMDKVIELVGKDVPIVLITPMGYRLNQRKNSARWKKMRDTYPKITSIISLPLDCFEDTLFHCEVICYNTPYLDPHYFVDL